MSEKQRQVFGIYRTGWTDPLRARYLERLVFTLHRRGKMTLGRLRGFCKAAETIGGEETFIAALKALVEWKFIEVTKTGLGNTFQAECIIEPTVLAEGWGLTIAGDEQREARQSQMDAIRG